MDELCQNVEGKVTTEETDSSLIEGMLIQKGVTKEGF